MSILYCITKQLYVEQYIFDINRLNKSKVLKLSESTDEVKHTNKFK